MAADYGETVNLEYDEFNEPVEEKKDKKVWIIVAVVVFILLCCCVIVFSGAVWLWNNGDQMLDEFGTIVNIVQYLAV